MSAGIRLGERPLRFGGLAGEIVRVGEIRVSETLFYFVFNLILQIKHFSSLLHFFSSILIGLGFDDFLVPQ